MAIFPFVLLKMEPDDQEIGSDPTRLRGELARLRADAARSQGLLDAILEQSPHGIIVSDPRGELVLQNGAAEKIWAGTAIAGTVEDWGNLRSA